MTTILVIKDNAMAGTLFHNLVAQQDNGSDVCSLNDLEQTSIRALIAYTADEYKISTEVVASLVTDRFGVNDIKQMQYRDYDQAIRYLIDINPKEIIN